MNYLNIKHIIVLILLKNKVNDYKLNNFYELIY